MGTVHVLVPAALAGLLGVLVHGAESTTDYVHRLRLMAYGAVLLGLLGAAVFFVRKGQDWRRWGAVVLALVTVRALYVPILAAGYLLAGWCDWFARLAGADPMGGVVHYALGCFTAFVAGMVALSVVTGATHLRRPAWVAVLLFYGVIGVVAFAHPRDRRVLPHPLAKQAPQPVSSGPGYLTVVEDKSQGVVTRILAGGSGVRHALSPRTGWGGNVRDEMLARFQGEPTMSLGDRITCMEASLLSARREFRTSPRTPPE